MRYWVYDEKKKSVGGPHLKMLLLKLPGFGPESKVALEGARGPNDWKRAKDVEELKSLFPEPAAAPPPPEKPKG